MSDAARRWLERGKSLLILLLTLTALFLTAKAFWYSDGGQGGLLNRLIPSVTSPSPQPSNSLGQSGVHQPVRMAVVNANGRYGAQYDTAAVDELFQHLGGLLGEALDTAQAPTKTTRRAWEDALARTGIYFDFLGAAPLSMLASWLGGQGNNTALTQDAARILLAHNPEGTQVLLYYVDAQDGSYYTCKTAVQFGTLLDSYIPNGASFAFQLADRYGDLAPDVLLLTDPPAPPLYTSSIALDVSDTTLRDGLLKNLDFTPQSQSIYPAADGWSVRDGADLLRLTGSGMVTYFAGEGDVRYPVPATATPTELIEATGRLVDRVLTPLCGAARIYLSSFTQEGDVTTLTYSYLLSGAEVYLGNAGWCASFTITGGQISDYTLHLRTYASTPEIAVLLPEYQAMAAMDALDAAGRNLLLRYYDSGSGFAAPAWTGR